MVRGNQGLWVDGTFQVAQQQIVDILQLVRVEVVILHHIQIVVHRQETSVCRCRGIPQRCGDDS